MQKKEKKKKGMKQAGTCILVYFSQRGDGQKEFESYQMRAGKRLETSRETVMANDPLLFDQHKSVWDVLDSTAAC